jgi:hypothetical protein
MTTSPTGRMSGLERLKKAIRDFLFSNKVRNLKAVS